MICVTLVPPVIVFVSISLIAAPPRGDAHSRPSSELQHSIAQLITISNEQYRQANTASQLSQSVRRAIVTKADQAFVAQVAPTPPAVSPPAGLLSISGTTAAAAPVTDSLDSLIDLLAELESKP